MLISITALAGNVSRGGYTAQRACFLHSTKNTTFTAVGASSECYCNSSDGYVELADDLPAPGFSRRSCALPHVDLLIIPSHLAN